MIFIVMGVSGCGKSIIGRLLARKLKLQFCDTDEFHSKANTEKMKKGIPLTDDDRIPWLFDILKKIVKFNKSGGAVIACSALKESYRKILASNVPVQFIYLKGSLELVFKRVLKRKNHFFPSKLVKIQFECLEEPTNSITVSINRTPEKILKEIITKINKSKNYCI